MQILLRAEEPHPVALEIAAPAAVAPSHEGHAGGGEVIGADAEGQGKASRRKEGLGGLQVRGGSFGSVLVALLSGARSDLGAKKVEPK